jgi:outer membrane protein assembly factor BamD
MQRSLLALFAALALLAVMTTAGCGMLAEKDETQGWSAQKLYGEAKDAMANRAFDKAAKYLEKLEARYPYGRFAQQAQLDVAYCYWKNGERASALAAADRFIKLYPGHANVDYAYYLKGLVNFNENQGFLSIIDNPDLTERDSKGTRESFEAFKDLVTRFPDSKYAEDGQARMRYLVNSLAMYEVHVARYYMKRGAYVAAANRAQYAVQNYPQAPALEEAVFIMVKAYDNLGMTDLRDSADRVMRKNFPDSKYLKGVVTLSAPWWKLWDPNW